MFTESLLIPPDQRSALMISVPHYKVSRTRPGATAQQYDLPDGTRTTTGADKTHLPTWPVHLLLAPGTVFDDTSH